MSPLRTEQSCWAELLLPDSHGSGWSMLWSLWSRNGQGCGHFFLDMPHSTNLCLTWAGWYLSGRFSGRFSGKCQGLVVGYSTPWRISSICSAFLSCDTCTVVSPFCMRYEIHSQFVGLCRISLCHEVRQSVLLVELHLRSMRIELLELRHLLLWMSQNLGRVHGCGLIMQEMAGAELLLLTLGWTE